MGRKVHEWVEDEKFVEDKEEESKGLMETFFETKWNTIIYKGRYIWLFVVLTWTGIAIWQMTNMKG
jgi:hypothetical protein